MYVCVLAVEWLAVVWAPQRDRSSGQLQDVYEPAYVEKVDAHTQQASTLLLHLAFHLNNLLS